MLIVSYNMLVHLFLKQFLNWALSTHSQPEKIGTASKTTESTLIISPSSIVRSSTSIISSRSVSVDSIKISSTSSSSFCSTRIES